MKKIFIYFLLIALLIAPATAVINDTQEISYPSLNEECQDFGFDFGYSRWIWNDNESEYELSEQSEGFLTNVTGDEVSFDWTSEPNATGIVTKEVCNFQVSEGGANGTVSQYNDLYGIEYVTFCGDLTQDPEIPEFGTLAAGIALIGAVAGFLIKRKVGEKK